ncbi:LETM1 domain-containing protein 1 [Macrobrachium rosenbergii]|uniref:LETM1 domain-containing protein 1 n=1 Tax=Macrobrachium rosenbergii TaxID=79674 RepID=UPI0034D67E10
MSLFLQSLRNNRYQRVLQVNCYYCFEAHVLQCLASSNVFCRVNSNSKAYSKRSFVYKTQYCVKAEDNFWNSSIFQESNCRRLNGRFCHFGLGCLQPQHYYSTKKNIVFSSEEEKSSPKTDTISDRVTYSRVPGSSEGNSKKEISVSDSDILSKSSNNSSSASPSSMITPETILTDVSKSTIDSKIGDEKLLSRLQKYLLWRFTWYLKRFQQSLENEMPDTFHMFRIFSIGLKEFVLDFKDFIKVLIIISMPGSTLRSLSRREIELYYNMPGDMLRVFPILVISSLPFGQNIAFPIGYWFPKHLLCHHFWDIKQRHDFALVALKKRLFNARPVFRSMQAALLSIEQKEYQDRCRAVFYKLGSGIHPTPAEVIALLPLFQGYPFHLHRIRAMHVNGLLRLHGKSVWFRRRQGLQDHAKMLHYLDTAISREEIDSLNYDQLKSSLFLRGVNPTNMSTKSMTDFMERWLTVSREVDSSSYSLLLHLPILLAYNQPTNFVLIY